MDDTADAWRDPNPWHPIKDAIDLKTLGKLGEECGELSSAVSRCIIQGVNEKEPVTGKSNKQWLQEEVADVLANIELVAERFNLNEEEIYKRVERKKVHLRKWHSQA